MLKMKEVRERIKECLVGREIITTAEIKEQLKELGLVYNDDYDVKSFGNAVYSLNKQKVIVPYGHGKKGVYRVVHESDIKISNINENEIKERKRAKIMEKSFSNEKELKEMREKIRESLKEYHEQIKQIFDSEKPSTYGKNPKTYNDIVELMNYLENFKFSVEE